MIKTLLKIPIILLVILLGITCFSQPGSMTYLNSDWVNQSPVVGSGIYHSSSIIVSNQLVVTTKVLNVDNSDIATLRYDSNGDTLWMKTYGGSADLNDYGVELAQTSTGDILVAGTIQNTVGGYDYVVLRYHGITGALQWSYTWDGAIGGTDIPTHITVDNSDNIYVTGGTEGATGFSNYATIKLSSSGIFQWASYYNYADLHDGASSVQVNGPHVVVSGASAAAIGDWDLATLRLNPSTGAITHEYRSDIAASLVEVNAMTTDESNNVYVTGYSESAGDKNIETIKLDEDLNLVWAVNYVASIEDIGNDIAVDNEGNVYVVGQTQKSIDKFQSIILKYSSSGTEIWIREYGDIIDNNGSKGKRIKVSPEDEVFITGTSENLSGNKAYFFNKYTNEGVFVVSGTYESIGVDNDAYDISLDEDNVYITGLSNGGGSQQTTVVKYSLGERNLNPVSIDGIESHLDDEIIIRFNKDAVIHSTVDNDKKRFGELQDFVESDVIIDLQTAYPNMTWATARTYKIFNGLKTTDTISITRQGFEIAMEPFWATLLVTVNDENEGELAELLDTALFPHISYAHLNYLHELHSDDPLYPEQHSLMSATSPEGDLNIETAWEYETGKDHILVGIYDGGIRYTHEDLGGEVNSDGGKIRGGKDFSTGGDLTTVDNNGDPIHPEIVLNGHGTRSAGLIAGFTNNEHGVAGIAGGNWPYLPGDDPTDIEENENKGVSLYGMKIRPGGMAIFPLDIVIAAVIEGASNTHEGYGYGLHLIHCGFGVSHVTEFPEKDNAVYDMQEHVFRNGVTMVASQGNLNLEQYITPAFARKEFWTIATGSSNGAGTKLDLSSYGTNMDIIAPGHDVLIQTTSNNADDAYINFGFTSAAAAHVSGVTALILSHVNSPEPSAGNLTGDDIEFLIQRYAEDKDETDHPDYSVGYDKYTGHGTLDAGNIMTHIDKNEYVIRHYYSNTVFDDIGGFGDDVLTEFKDETHPYGNYLGHVHTISRTHTHTLNPGDVITNYWPLHSYTNSINFNLTDDYQTRFEYEMDMHSVTSSSAVLTAQTFHFLEDPDGNPVDFWYPFAPGETVKLAYTLHIKTNYASLEEEENEFLLSCYPNPADETLNLEFILEEANNVGVQIIDINGKVVITKGKTDYNIGQQNLKINVNSLSSGIYTVRLRIGEKHYYDKFIKN